MSYLWLFYIIPLVLFSLSIYLIVYHSILLYRFQNVLQKRTAEIISYDYITYKYKTNIRIDGIDTTQTVELDYLPIKGNKIDVYIDLNDLSSIFTSDDGIEVKSILYIIVNVIIFLISLFLFSLKIEIKRKERVVPITSSA